MLTEFIRLLSLTDPLRLMDLSEANPKRNGPPFFLDISDFDFRQ